jgi:antitoxin (DNA-binding transcriptional repressor) of toxin-antitoxin stability system
VVVPAAPTLLRVRHRVSGPRPQRPARACHGRQDTLTRAHVEWDEEITSEFAGYRTLGGHGRIAVIRLRLGIAWLDAAVTAAFEVSPDDPQGLAEAIKRAAQGDVVHLVRDGQAVADIVPVVTAQTNKGSSHRTAPSRALRRTDAGGLPQGLPKQWVGVAR